jgi:hypothetical protein
LISRMMAAPESVACSSAELTPACIKNLPACAPILAWRARAGGLPLTENQLQPEMEL